MPRPLTWFTEETRASGEVHLTKHTSREDAEAFAALAARRNAAAVVIEEREGVHLRQRWEHHP